MNRHSIVSPFGNLLADLRSEGVRNHTPTRHANARPARPRPPRPEGAPDPDLLLESGVVSGGRPRSSRSWRWAPALAVHAAFLAAVVAVPLLLPDDLPSPVSGAKVFLVQAIAPPPPPPPPAPPRPVARTATPRPSAATRATTPVSTVARAEVKPEEVMPPASLDVPAPPADEGVPGGVDEGVPGAIVGGVLEKVSATEPASPTLRVGGAIKEPRKLKNVAPVYPDVASRAMVEGIVILEIAIEPNGHVDDVRVLRSIPLLDAAAVAAARQWVFAPTLYRGVPVSVTMTVSVRFSLTQGTSAS
jgi:protein TonB